MGLMLILFCYYREDVIWVKIMSSNLIKVGSGKCTIEKWEGLVHSIVETVV